MTKLKYFMQPVTLCYCKEIFTLAKYSFSFDINTDNVVLPFEMKDITVFFKWWCLRGHTENKSLDFLSFNKMYTIILFTFINE